MIRIKRIYEVEAADDGYRVLVDRLWPRGVSKENARVDLWMKDIAPSPYLRKWFCHDPEKWSEFTELYEKELRANTEGLDTIKELEEKYGAVTLLYAAKDSEHTHARVLLNVLDSMRAGRN